uniref:Protein FAR1-RELATED SEQUENCE n=1 Tax=Arundo donax TaxID=35708 RepID=A0A0A8ZAG1_ARUDO
MPGTCHRLCLWHILTIASKLVQGVAQEQSFRKDFENLIYGIYSVDDFRRERDCLISKHRLADVPWFSELFAAQERWSLDHCGDTFCGLTGTKQWSETMENLFKFRFYRKLPLSKFIVQYFNVVTNLREEELAQDCESWQDKPILLVDVPLLAEAAKTYTRRIYVDFEQEYRSHLACICERFPTDGTTHKFRVTPIPQKQCSGVVEFDPASTSVSCNCKKFESSGILCMQTARSSSPRAYCACTR